MPDKERVNTFSNKEDAIAFVRGILAEGRVSKEWATAEIARITNIEELGGEVPAKEWQSEEGIWINKPIQKVLKVPEPLSKEAETAFARAEDIVVGYVKNGTWTEEEGSLYLTELWTQWKQHDEDVRRVEASAEIQRQIEEGEALGRQQYGLAKVSVFQEKQQGEAKQQREAFDTKVNEILASSQAYDQKVGALANLVNTNREGKLRAEANPYYFYNLQAKVFAQLSEEEQQLRRLRAAYPLAEREYRTPLEVRRQAELARTPRYETIFEGARGGWTGSQPYRDWYERTFASELSQFMAGLPKEKQPAEEVEKSYAEFLGKRRPELYERFKKQSSFQRGERPSYFAPPIRTVSF